MNEGKLNTSQRITLVSNNAKLFAGSGLEDLAIEQIGVFAKAGKSRFKGTKTPLASSDTVFKIVQGFADHTKDYPSRAQVPSHNHETVTFSAKQIKGWEATKAKPFTKEPVVALGYDGVDPAKGLQVLKGKDVKVYVHLQGGPIQRLTNGNAVKWLDMELFISKDCLVDDEPGSYQNQKIIQKKIIEQWNKRKFSNIPLSRFAKATAVSTCAQSSSGLTAYTSYQVSIVDMGQDFDLGLVQTQYPGLGVKRVKRSNLISTYELTQLTSAGAPTAVNLATFPVLPNCTTCPTGYTLRAAGAVFQVTVGSEETPANQTGQISKTLLSQGPEQDVWEYIMPAATVPATFKAAVISGTADAEVLSLGLKQSLCIPPTAATAAWASSGTSKQATQTYVITLKDSVCGTDRLADLQAVYPTNSVAIDTTNTLNNTCAHRYTMTVVSDIVVDDPCGEETYTFAQPDAYDGANWIAQPATLVTGCTCGVIFEGARFTQSVTAGTFPYIGYDTRDFDPVHIGISDYNHDYQDTLCQNPFPFTVLQEADYPVGYGRDVIPLELDSLGYFAKGVYNYQPIVRELYGEKFLTKPDQYYDEYLLTVGTGHKTSNTFTTAGFDITYRFYFPVGQGAEFEAAINGLVASADLGLAEVRL